MSQPENNTLKKDRANIKDTILCTKVRFVIVRPPYPVIRKIVSTIYYIKQSRKS